MKEVLFTLIIALVLSGCGGIEESSGSIVETSTFVSTVLADNYTADTPISDAYNFLNSQRQLCGFGLLQQSIQIDAAAQAHADYLRLNNLPPSPFEDQAQFPNGFTGVTVQDRLRYKGYSGGATEIIGSSSVSNYGSSDGRAHIMGFFLAPYHGLAALQSYRDIGFGYTPTSTEMVIDFGVTENRPKQLLAGDQVVTYPCAGITDVPSESDTDENPAPIAGRNLSTDPIGHPIYIKVRDSHTLSLSSYELKNAETNDPVTLQLLNKTTDQNKLIQSNSEIILIPLIPLDINTQYQFTATGVNKFLDVHYPVNISFTFRTGAD